MATNLWMMVLAMALLAGVGHVFVIDDGKLPCELRQCSPRVCLEHRTTCPGSSDVMFRSRCTKRLPSQCSGCYEEVCVLDVDDEFFCRSKFKNIQEEELMAAVNFLAGCGSRDSGVPTRIRRNYTESVEDNDQSGSAEKEVD